ncbi:MAG: response regulator [Bacteroidales bacterium]|nr:response regulator [Bacteroidales bacterium]
MKKILVVDDQKNVRIAISIGLGREGYLVDAAGNAQGALLKLKETNYDVVLADVKMPDINGFVLATLIKELYPQIKIILMSAFDFRDFEGKYQEVNSCPKISKPFEMLELLKLLNNGMDSNKLTIRRRERTLRVQAKNADCSKKAEKKI